MKLYELTGQLKELASMEDMDAETIKDTLEALEGDFKSKSESVVAVVNELSLTTDGIDSEIKRLQARKKAIENRKASLTDYLRVNMEASGISKIECPLFTITCVKGQELAVITDEAVLPDDCVNVKTEIKPDKREITKRLKDGQDIPGAHLERGKSSIRIK